MGESVEERVKKDEPQADGMTAVDSALMVIDGAKGVEDRTIKLMNVCRLRDTPIITFVNKLDRDIRDAIELVD